MSSEGSNIIFLKVSYTVWTKFFSNKIDSQPHKTWTWSPLLSFFPLRDVSSKSKHRHSELLPFYNASKSILTRSFKMMSHKTWFNYLCLINHKTENKFMFSMNISWVIGLFTVYNLGYSRGVLYFLNLNLFIFNWRIIAL